MIIMHYAIKVKCNCSTWNKANSCVLYTDCAEKQIFTSPLFLLLLQPNGCVIKKFRVKCSCRLSNRLSFLVKRQAKKRDSFDTIPFKLISSYGGYIRDEYEAYVTTKDCKLQDLLTVYPQI